jgi:hypothetical protein
MGRLPTAHRGIQSQTSALELAHLDTRISSDSSLVAESAHVMAPSDLPQGNAAVLTEAPGDVGPPIRVMLIV